MTKQSQGREIASTSLGLPSRNDGRGYSCGPLPHAVPAGQKGLTLIELILALAIVSFILLAGTSLNIASMRLTGGVNDELRLHNQIHYVLRDMELKLRDGKNPRTRVGAANCQNLVNFAFDECVSVEVGNAVPPTLVVYGYQNADRRVTRQDFTTAPATSAVLSEFVLVPRVDDRTGAAIPIFEIAGLNNKIVRVQLAAEWVVNGRTIEVAGSTKAILLRGGE